MSKARTLADFISDGSEFADGTISVAEVSGAAPLASPTFTGNVDLGDNVKLRLGDSDDLQLYHDGQNSYISDQGTGNIKILANDFRIKNAADTESLIQANQNGEVYLYYNNSVKLATVTDGVDITGDVGATTATITGTVTAGQYDSTEALPTVRPSLLLDFANSKTLDPRITFTRGSTATYWDGKTTTKAEENLLTYSDSCFGGDWSTFGTASITTNNATAPDGTTTATLYTTASGGGKGAVFYNPSFSGNHTRTVYVKKGTADYFFMDYPSSAAGVWWNLSTGAVATDGSGAAFITSVGNGWYRLGIRNATKASAGIAFGFSNADNTDNSTSGQTGYFWGAQVEARSTETAYTATTSSPIVKHQPTLQTAASGEARFDHDPVTGESKGLLIEEARTNLLNYSEDFTQWSKNSLNVESNVAIAPDGTLTADKLRPNTLSANNHFVSYGASTVLSTRYVFSCYVKHAGQDKVIIHTHGNPPAAFNLTTNSWDSATGYYGYFNEDVGNGWYRIGIEYNTNGTNVYIGGSDTNSYGYTPTENYSGILVWGAQVEEGSFFTSYIPTSGSTVTRAQDLSVVNNFDTVAGSSVFGISGYVEVEHIEDAGNIPVGFVDASDTFNYSTYIISRYISGQSPQFLLKNGGTGEASLTVTLTETNKTVTYGFAASREDVAFTANGLTPSTSTTATPPQWVKMSMGSSPWGQDNGINGYIKKVALYPKRLSDATLTAMTEA